MAVTNTANLVEDHETAPSYTSIGSGQGAAQDAEFERPIEVVISDTDPEEAYVFRVQEKGISVVPHSDCGDCECARSWNANIGYLRDVAQNSQAYINNPAKLDWGWIYDT